MNETTTLQPEEGDRELWSIAQVAEHLGTASTGSARRSLSRWGVSAVEYRKGPSERAEARYDAEEVRAGAANRPGRGTRTDLEREQS